MTDKKHTIIEASIKLFAEKGYHATSIQEIVNQSHVSKGAFYLYFDSKEDLALSIFQTYSNNVWEKVDKIKQLDVSPEEKFKKQIEMFFETLSSHKEYFMVAMRENISFGDKLEDFIHYMNEKSYRWAADSLISLYGEKITPYLSDGVIQLEGLLQGYFKYIILHNLQADSGKIADFIVARMEDMVNGMIHTGQVSSVQVDLIVGKKPGEGREGKNLLLSLIEELKNKLQNSRLTEKEKQQSVEAANVIKEEAEKENPNPVLIQGMLHYFQNMRETKEVCEQIARLLNIHLPNGNEGETQ